MCEVAGTAIAAVGISRRCTVYPCDCSHVAPGNAAAGRRCCPTSSRCEARQSNAIYGAVIEGWKESGGEFWGGAGGPEANKDKLTSDQRRQGYQACAVRQGPCQSCSSSVVGQGWRRAGSEHWRSCSRSQQWTWRDRWRAGELRGRVGNCACGKERSAGEERATSWGR